MGHQLFRVIPRIVTVFPFEDLKKRHGGSEYGGEHNARTTGQDLSDGSIITSSDWSH
jgi:hypothetical protein